jgi:outer membrane protein OmpA-like peptidoglycan-associated protein/osmotically-inducible protein OsmY
MRWFLLAVTFGLQATTMWLALGRGAEIEADVARRARAALQAEGFDGVRVDAAGRSLTLTGKVPSEGARRGALTVAGVDGHDTVDALEVMGRDDLSLHASEPDDTLLVLSGTVASPEERQRIVALAREFYGPDFVRDDDLTSLQLDGSATVGPSAYAVIPMLAMGVTGGELVATEAAVRVTGTAVDARVPGEVRGAIDAVVPEPTQLAVHIDYAWSPADYFLEVSEATGEVVVAGVFADAESRDRFLRIAAREIGVTDVIDMTALAGVPAPDTFGRAVTASLPYFQQVERAEAYEDADGYRFSGLGDDRVVRDLQSSLRQARLPADFSKTFEVATRLPMEACQRLLDRILDAGDVGFEPNARTLTAESHGVLERTAPVLRRCPDLKVWVVVMTADQSDESRNQQLSAARANAVRERMTYFGLSPDRFEPRGIGSVEYRSARMVDLVLEGDR